MNPLVDLPRLIKEHTFLGEKLSGVFTYIPAEATFPYVTLELQETKKNHTCEVSKLAVRIWSAYKGGQEVNELESNLSNLFDQVSEKTDFKTTMKRQKSELVIDPSQIRHVLMTYTLFSAKHAQEEEA